LVARERRRLRNGDDVDVGAVDDGFRSTPVVKWRKMRKGKNLGRGHKC
jgi:hypothetical protein